jgi:hypothetical protein
VGIKMQNKGLMAALLLCGMATAAGAEPISYEVASKNLFSPKGASVEMLPVPGLLADNAALLESVVKDYAYYAAVAVAPEEELLTSEATVLVANHHSAEAAAAAALAGCNAARKGGAECVLAGLVRPKKWAARDFQLSLEGTLVLTGDYKKQKGPRAMAISAQTGFFGLGFGAQAPEAAVQACADKGATDCAVAVVDPG